MSGPEYTSLPATDVDNNMSGNIFVPNTPGSDENTLDEPISTTLMRDIKAVGSKFYHVIIPRDGSLLLNDWDLWGPLILCTLLAIILQGHSDGKHDGGPQFAQVFVIIWVGAGVVTLNSKLLDGRLSFFQSICVLGYCVFPLAVGAVLVKMFSLFGLKKGLIAFIVDFVVVGLAFVWAMFAAVCFLKPTNNPGKKIISTYPVGLFYFVIAWLVISQP